MNPDELRTRLQELVESGTEEQVRRFIIEHFKEFPEPVQRELVVSLFSEALVQKGRDQAALAGIRQRAAELIASLES